MEAVPIIHRLFSKTQIVPGIICQSLDNCGDNSDEACRLCLPREALCNGIADCADSSDERNCSTSKVYWYSICISILVGLHNLSSIHPSNTQHLNSTSTNLKPASLNSLFNNCIMFSVLHTHSFLSVTTFHGTTNSFLTSMMQFHPPLPIITTYMYSTG